MSKESHTSSELIGIARFKFHEGKVEEFKRLCVECMEIVRTKDTGTLQYDTFINDNETEAIVIERYKDSEAAIEHNRNIGEEMMNAVLATGTVYGELLGNITPELKAKLEGSPVQPFTTFLSM